MAEIALQPLAVSPRSFREVNPNCRSHFAVIALHRQLGQPSAAQLLRAVLIRRGCFEVAQRTVATALEMTSRLRDIQHSANVLGLAAGLGGQPGCDRPTLAEVSSLAWFLRARPHGRWCRRPRD